MYDASARCGAYTAMILETTPIAGVFVAHTYSHVDARGRFARLFCKDDLAEALQGHCIAQINQSLTNSMGTIRGLHFQQPPHAETKLVRCLRGSVWDVAVDIRAGSPTLLSWYGVELAPTNGRMLIVPEGCAHGFQALAPNSELLYLHTRAYAPDAEGGIAWNDAAIGVRWPLPLPKRDGLSERDRNLAPVEPGFAGIPV